MFSDDCDAPTKSALGQDESDIKTNDTSPRKHHEHLNQVNPSSGKEKKTHPTITIVSADGEAIVQSVGCNFPSQNSLI